MKGIAFRTISIGILLGSLACGVKSRTVDMNPTFSRNPTCENAVAVYDGRADVPSSYYELAWIEVEGNSVWTTDNQMRDKMKKRAAEVGANGLIANPVQQNKVGVNVLGEAMGAHSATARASGLAIWIPADDDRTRLACGTR
jgi:hypothetical protein